MYNEDVKFAAEQLKALVGFKIVDTVISDDNESYGFIVQSPTVRGHTKKKVCWVDCDPEGNGPGWLQIEEMVNEPAKATSG